MVKIKKKFLFAVQVAERNYNTKVYLVDAFNKKHAKNLAEAKFYEETLGGEIIETKTKIWKVFKNLSNLNNPSVR